MVSVGALGVSWALDPSFAVPMQRTIEKYEILEELGHGGMATVYRARDTRLDRAVAIKVMHPHLRKTPEARERFIREARSVARLTHPNILEIYDNSERDSDEAFIVTELLTGPTLKSFAEERPPLLPEIAACMVIEVARALGAAHRAGIVHRDVKPENVLIHEARCLKLTDFGIAHMVDAHSFTATGQILGSPGHMAPEQVEGGDCDERTDLFSVGTVLYYLATGRLPFEGRNPHQVLKRIVDGDYKDPVRVRPAVGGHLGRIITKALATDPKDRYQTADEFVEALTTFLGEAGIADPKALLARFFSDPDEMEATLRDDVVERLTEQGERAVREGDYEDAMDRLNRVLALDDGNEKVLAIIERMGNRSRRRTGLFSAGAALALFGLGALGVAALATGTSTTDPGPGPGDPIGSDDAGRATVAVSDSGAGPDREDAGDSDAGPATREAGPPTVALTSAPRTVCFAPNPANVEISVDGRPRQAFGADARCQPLSPGRHRVEVFGAEACCEPFQKTFQVVSGAGRQLVPLRLRYRDARFYVVLDAATTGRVEVEGGASGRARSFIFVPMSGFRDTRRFTVTAPGYEAYTGSVRLVAGQDTQVSVTLVASEEAP